LSSPEHSWRAQIMGASPDYAWQASSQLPLQLCQGGGQDELSSEGWLWSSENLCLGQGHRCFWRGTADELKAVKTLQPHWPDFKSKSWACEQGNFTQPCWALISSYPHLIGGRGTRFAVLIAGITTVFFQRGLVHGRCVGPSESKSVFIVLSHEIDGYFGWV
jgi:hypothetical protein